MSARCWEPGTQYNYGDVVEYQGHRYKIIQPHCSQSDWAPGPATLALWGPLSDNDNHYGGGDYKQQQDYQQQQQQQQQQQGQYNQQQQGQYNQNQQSQNQSEPPKPEHWYDNEETKKRLEIGGGLAAGAALLAGGLFAYKKHEENKEDAKNEGWAHGNWLNDARARKENYLRGGSRDAATWVLTKGQAIPHGAILVGREKSWNLYSCRAFYHGGIQLGKASEAFQHGGVLGYDNKEIFVDEYEVLVGDMNRLCWIQFSGELNPATLGHRLVEGGYDADGSPLYVAEAPHKDAVHPGKASPKFKGAYIAYDGKEKHVEVSRVLCYNNY